MDKYIILEGWDCQYLGNLGIQNREDRWSIMFSEKEPEIGAFSPYGGHCYSWVSGFSTCAESASKCAVVIKQVEPYTPERAQELGLEKEVNKK